MLCCRLLSCTVCCASVSDAVLFCVVLSTYCYCTVLYRTALHCTALYCTTALHCTVLCCPVLCRPRLSDLSCKGGRGIRVGASSAGWVGLRLWTPPPSQNYSEGFLGWAPATPSFFVFKSLVWLCAVAPFRFVLVQAPCSTHCTQHSVISACCGVATAWQWPEEHPGSTLYPGTVSPLGGGGGWSPNDGPNPRGVGDCMGISRQTVVPSTDASKQNAGEATFALMLFQWQNTPGVFRGQNSAPCSPYWCTMNFRRKTYCLAKQ